MTDVIDRANDLAAEMLERSIAEKRCSCPPLEYTGRCHNYGEPLEASKRFCDKECCADFEHRMRRTGCR